MTWETSATGGHLRIKRPHTNNLLFAIRTCLAHADLTRVTVHHPDVVFSNWSGSLMTIAVALTAVFFNTVLVRLLPYLEFIMLVLRESHH